MSKKLIELSKKDKIRIANILSCHVGSQREIARDTEVKFNDKDLANNLRKNADEAEQVLIRFRQSWDEGTDDEFPQHLKN